MAKTYKRKQEEKRIGDELIRPSLRDLGWHVEVTHSTHLFKGFPDLYLMHPRMGQRWVDVKVEGDYEFTDAQRDKWPRWYKFGTGVWIMTDWSQDQYEKLFKPCNFMDYWKPKYGDPFKEFDLIELLDTIEEEKE